MGQPKVIVALVAALVLAIGSFVAGLPLVAVLVLVLGAGAVFYFLREGGAVLERPRRGGDEFLEADDDTEERTTSLRSDALSTWAPDTVEAEPLSSWAPETTTDAEPLSSWSPETSTEAEPLSTWESEPLATWDAAPAVEAEEAVVDEAEEIAFASSLISSPINEDVATADDIMAASEATELHIGDDSAAAGGEDSELAKLLAKVQARLAAYE